MLIWKELFSIFSKVLIGFKLLGILLPQTISKPYQVTKRWKLYIPLIKDLAFLEDGSFGVDAIYGIIYRGCVAYSNFNLHKLNWKIFIFQWWYSRNKDVPSLLIVKRSDEQ